MGLVFNPVGAMLMPRLAQETGEVCFAAQNSTTQTNLTSYNETTIHIDEDLFDLGGDFDVDTYTFTAPVDGYYLLLGQCKLQSMDTAASSYNLYLRTSNRTCYVTFDPKLTADFSLTLAVGQVFYMDALDTAHLAVMQGGGTAQTDVQYDNSFLCGVLLKKA